MRDLDNFIDRNISALRSFWRRVSGDSYKYALLPYLMEVLEFYRALEKRDEAEIARERISELYEFKLRDDMHPIRCIIEASSKGRNSNEKNRMTQALRYALKRKWSLKVVVDKIKENGGIKGCADKFGRANKGARYSPRRK
jgi:hypothetical protein